MLVLVTRNSNFELRYACTGLEQTLVGAACLSEFAAATSELLTNGGFVGTFSKRVEGVHKVVVEVLR